MMGNRFAPYGIKEPQKEVPVVKIEKTGKKEVSLKHFITGAIAGAVSRTTTCPLERLKILRQTSVKSYSKLSLDQAMMKIYRNEGIIGFYKGNGVNIFRASPCAALEFLFYEIYKSLLIKPEDVGTFQSKLVCGALTGVTANTITYPLDLVKTILSVQLNPRHYKKGIIGHLKIIYRKEGILGFYKGWVTTMIGIAPYIAIKMATFDVLKTRFCPDKNTPHFDIINLACGAAAGMISMSVTYPLDLVKRRIQLAGINKHARSYDGLFHCLVSMLMYEGPRSFWKGLNPCILKMIPATAILFATNERLKKWLNVE
ncbi:unnamed protein product [Moneuplotes crassus]|uniref:Mitochondrial carrier protein n=1 Tax=Euplotes crassus TaxID=5936 RepID=A0AAD1XKJ1_EUPCR|nr:unnamed protein product [Moneuplotes crassus]